MDKLTLVALAATLRLYAEGREREIPTLSYLARPIEEVKRMATRLGRAYNGLTRVERALTEVGAGRSPAPECRPLGWGSRLRTRMLSPRV